METRVPYVLLGRVGDNAAAQLLAAKLAAEGIEARVRSEASGPYVFNVGRMAEAELWVAEPDLAAARQVMLDAEVADALGPVETGTEELPAWSTGARVIAFLVVAVIVVLILRRFLLLAAG
jgi:hypothetical protein